MMDKKKYELAKKKLEKQFADAKRDLDVAYRIGCKHRFFKDNGYTWSCAECGAIAADTPLWAECELNTEEIASVRKYVTELKLAKVRKK